MAELDIKSLGDQLAGLTLKQAVELADYLKTEHKIEPAAGAVIQMGGGGGGAEVLRPMDVDQVLGEQRRSGE